MISDPNALSIEVTVDDSVVAANKSVSLGLIVTELVINALKHAFPGHARGKIVVDYRSNGPDWNLSVEDDGIGMPTGDSKAKPGLGTGIIEALAKHLGAGIEVLRSDPGIAITISQNRELSGLRHATAVCILPILIYRTDATSWGRAVEVNCSEISIWRVARGRFGGRGPPAGAYGCLRGHNRGRIRDSRGEQRS